MCESCKNKKAVNGTAYRYTELENTIYKYGDNKTSLKDWINLVDAIDCALEHKTISSRDYDSLRTKLVIASMFSKKLSGGKIPV